MKETKELIFAPREIFETILEYAVIPTFDLVIQMPSREVVIVRRRIAPYEGQWALPGLRMMKPENIDDTLRRIARQEVGIDIETREKEFLGQFVGYFQTEHNRQDISTGYAVKATQPTVLLNDKHFSGLRLIASATELPKNTGAMYRFYITEYFKRAAQAK